MFEKPTLTSCSLHPSECITHRWLVHSRTLASCYLCGLKRPSHNQQARFTKVHKEEGEWRYLFYLCSVFGRGNEFRDEEIRCTRSGTVEVYRHGQWIDGSFFELNRHQYEKIRKRCWGTIGKKQHPVFNDPNHIPRLVNGERFTISGCPEKDGEYICRGYGARGMIVRKLLPDYWNSNPKYRRINQPWPNDT